MMKSRMTGQFPVVLALVCWNAASAQPATPVSSVPLPSIPAMVFHITDYGAVGDGKTLNTRAVQRAIDACARAGGGTVDVPAGRFLTGPLALRSRLNLHLQKNAVLVLDSNVADYIAPGGHNVQCIDATDCHDVAITGRGTIDGQGGSWWPRYVKSYIVPPGSPPPPHRPFMVVFSRCTRVLVRDVSLTNSPSFHLVPEECTDVTIEGVHVNAPDNAPNTDGLDPSGWNFLIKGCVFDVGDDCIAVKPGRIEKNGRPSCENFTITGCTFLHGHGMSIGGQTRGGLRNMIVENCTFASTQAGIRMKSSRGAGGLVEDVTYKNLTMRNVKTPILITSYYPSIPKDPGADPAQPVNSLTPIWRHIQIQNVTATGGDTAGRIIGVPEAPVADVALTNVKISAKKGMDIDHARNIRFIESDIRVRQGSVVSLNDAEITGLDASVIPSTRVPSPSTTPLIVAADGSGEFKTVQAAIDALRPGSAGQPSVIEVKEGTYAERITVPRNKPFIQLVGAGAEKTILTFNLYASQIGADGLPIGTFRTASTTIDADDFTAENITFQNSAGPRGQALAIRIEGDRDAFHHCRFLGWQDTILDDRGRHYYDRCAVSGSVDFIFGAGTGVFNQCDITEIRDSGGVLTAPSTPQNQPYGLVFLSCRILKGAGVHAGSTTLMRPWRDYGMSAFIDCAMGDEISDRGWSPWDGREKTCRAIEYGSTTLSGQPVDQTQRAPWVRRLNAAEAAGYTVSNIFNGWDPVR